MTENIQNEKQEKVRLPVGLDWLRVVLGILVLSMLLSVSLASINKTFAEKQAELVEDSKKDFGWIAITVGYTVPLILCCAVPVAACLGSKKGAQRKHLIKGLIIAGAAVTVLFTVCPKEIYVLAKQRELAQAYEDMEDEDPEFIAPEDAPKLKETTAELERVVSWTTRAMLALAITGAYQGVRYKKLRDGDEDEEVPPEELDGDVPDVDWVEGTKKSKNS